MLLNALERSTADELVAGAPESWHPAAASATAITAMGMSGCFVMHLPSAEWSRPVGRAMHEVRAGDRMCWGWLRRRDPARLAAGLDFHLRADAHPALTGRALCLARFLRTADAPCGIRCR